MLNYVIRTRLEPECKGLFLTLKTVDFFKIRIIGHNLDGDLSS